MATALADVLGYVCHAYSADTPLTEAKATKILYLADWKNALVNARQITGVEWRFEDFGPYVPDVERTFIDDGRFDLDVRYRADGDKEELISLKPGSTFAELAPADRKSVDFALAISAKMDWDSFLRLISSTHPVLATSRHEIMNLVDLAADYKAIEQERSTIAR